MERVCVKKRSQNNFSKIYVKSISAVIALKSTVKPGQSINIAFVFKVCSDVWMQNKCRWSRKKFWTKVLEWLEMKDDVEDRSKQSNS